MRLNMVYGVKQRSKKVQHTILKGKRHIPRTSYVSIMLSSTLKMSPVKSGFAIKPYTTGCPYHKATQRHENKLDPDLVQNWILCFKKKFPVFPYFTAVRRKRGAKWSTFRPHDMFAPYFAAFRSTYSNNEKFKPLQHTRNWYRSDRIRTTSDSYGMTILFLCMFD